MGRGSACAAVLLAIVISAGCGGPKDDPILRLSAEESLIEGKALLEAKKFYSARQYLTHAFEVEPNSESGREALLLVADAHFLQGGSQNFIKAEAKYRDFQNRFPTSERSAYVQYQIAASLAGRMRRPDRDQSISHDALEAYQDLLRLFPESDKADEARRQIEVVKATLAEAEFLVGNYNFRRARFAKCGAVCFRAAVTRFERLLEEYPAYSEKDKIYYYLGLARLEIGEDEKAEEALQLLEAEYKGSKFLQGLERDRRQIAKDRAKREQKLARKAKRRS